MSDLKRSELPSLARRHFLGISTAVAGRIAAGGAVGLSILASGSKPAKAEHGHGSHGDDMEMEADVEMEVDVEVEVSLASSSVRAF